MEKVINFIKMFIPAYVEFRSLYWIQYRAKMDSALIEIFNSIDENHYEKADNLIADFELKFNQNRTGPLWVGIKYSEIYRAKSMLDFLKETR
jgi:hypothetical protein